jgi:hypothetical protein
LALKAQTLENNPEESTRHLEQPRRKHNTFRTTQKEAQYIQNNPEESTRHPGQPRRKHKTFGTTQKKA